MKKSDTTARFPQAFASQADSSVVAYPLPDTKQASGRVSLLNGFPLENFTALSAGGVPPSGADFNGLFRTLTEAIRANETGQIRAFNADYAQKIGGYPQSALVTDPANPARLLISTQDDNKTNPADGSSGAWVPVADGISALQDGLAAEKKAREDAVNAERNRAQTAEAGLQPKGNYVPTLSDDKQFSLTNISAERDTGIVWARDEAGNYHRLQPQGQYVTTAPDAAQTAVNILNVETATSTPWVLTQSGQFIRMQKEGSYPEFAGAPGRLVIQSFTVGGNGSVPVPTITFPRAYAPGTTPQVFLQIDDEGYRGKSRICCLESPAPGAPRVTNAAFTFRASYADNDGIGTTAVAWTLNVLAIGYM